MKQGTREWMDARSGIITASRLGDVMARKGTKRRNRYLREIVLELRGAGDIDTSQPWFEHGRDWEAEARGEFEWETGLTVSEVGLIMHPNLNYVGASPDGLVTDNDNIATAGLEIKCRTSWEAHQKISKGLPPEYRPQVQGGMMVTGLERWFFVSYYRKAFPSKGGGKLHDLRWIIVERDDDYIERMHAACVDFWNEVKKHG